MLNERTYNDIMTQLSKYEDIKKLSAKELASISYTSPSTISRFVKKMGYENFSEMKTKLVLEQELKNSTVLDIFGKWNTMFNHTFSQINQMDLFLLKELKNKQIKIYCDREYELVTRHFVDTMLANGYDCQLVNSIISDKYSPEDTCVIVIGSMIKDIYSDKLNYIQIKFEYNNTFEKFDNIHTIELQTPKSLSIKERNHNYHSACIQVLLCILIENIV